ncbi:MAG: 3-dehydroquinate synthase [Thermoanaerobacteraceae bacterium]|nr:3-dehydroquinate synthase [Thermoanaerobacteraceae bacterium]
MKKLDLKTGYDIYIDHDYNINTLLDKDKKYLYVIDEVVLNLYGSNISGEKVIVGPGEKAKDISTILKIYDGCIEIGLERDDYIVAIGGGSTGDAAGFAASTFKRGIGFINVPTTLLAMIDSSIGGKTAIDYNGIKNQIGTFYDPSIVYMDMKFLKTLPADVIKSSMGEVIKYAVLSRSFYEWLNKNLDMVLAMDSDIIEELVERCTTIKADIVNQDRIDRGVRAYLNLGHTIGHAIEMYYGVSHGLAVAAGIYYESLISYRMGMLQEGTLQFIISLIDRCAVDTQYPIDKGLISLMAHDKKNTNGRLGFILPEDIGLVKKVMIDEKELYDILKDPGI